MGRHSKPEPEDFADEPSEDHPQDFRAADAEPGGFPGGYGTEHPGDYSDDYLDDYPPDDHPEDSYADYGRYPDTDLSADDHGDEPADDYGEDIPDMPGMHTAPPPPPPTGGGHRGDDSWRGGHRSDRARRGVSIGVIAALLVVIVVVAGVILWRFFGDVLSKRSSTAAGRCVEGKETAAVIADPAIVDQVREFADRYNGSSLVMVGDHCVSVRVKSAGSDAVVNGFIGSWPSDLGDRPGLWIPGSSVSVARLSAAAGTKTISDSRSLVTSPVLIATRPELQPALAKQNWAALPDLQTKPDALAGLDLPAWGSLRLALPISGNSDAAYLAAEAVAAASAPPGAPPTAGSNAVRTLVGAQPKLADNSVAEAMNALLASGDPATAPVHAVVTTEQQLFARSESLPNAGHELASWLPPGPAAVADYPTVLLSGSWLSQEQVTAASAFARFMHKPEQLTELAKAGFRASGVSPPNNDVTKFAPLPSTLSVGDDAMRAALADTLTTPATGPAATIMLDQSMPTDEGGKSRLANVIAALKAQLQSLPPTSTIGLWTFDGKEGRPEVTTGLLSDPVNGRPRSAALTAALDKQYSSGGGAVSFTTLRMIYDNVKANFRPDQPNSILVITAGPHTDKTLDGPGLKDYIRGAFDPAKPIAVNVIDFGDDSDRPTWEGVAQLSGGSYRNLPTSDSPALTTALSTDLA